MPPLDPESSSRLESQIARLAEAVERFNADLLPTLDRLRGDLKSLMIVMKHNRALAEQIKLLNQIMLQTSKAAGISGMVGSLMTSLSQLVEKSR